MPPPQRINQRTTMIASTDSVEITQTDHSGSEVTIRLNTRDAVVIAEALFKFCNKKLVSMIPRRGDS